MSKNRSQKKELLDGTIANDDLILNLKELHTINRLLGGYTISIDALKKLNLHGKKIVDIGSGGGDMLHEIYKYTRKKDIVCSLFGIDLKPTCTYYAQSHLPSELTFITDDYKNMSHHVNRPDIIHACLFTHHLKDEQIIDLIRFSLKNHSILVINDLERNPIAFYAIKFLTKLFSKSHLVKHDAPLSVLRGFKKTEWKNLIELAGVDKYSLNWKWAFRHQIIIYG